VIETLKRWKSTKRQEPKEMGYIINHALRTLVKQGNEEALSFLGYQKHPQINVSDIILDSTIVCIGDSLSFDIEIEAQEDVNLMVDYIIYFRTKRGTFSPKVYKLKNLVLQKGEKIKLRKKHLFKINMSTRTFYEGEHKLEILINGEIVQSCSFDLREEY
jgi:hypothetical protein